MKISLEFGSCSSPYLEEFNCSTGLRIETANLFAKITKKGFFVNNNYKSDNSFFSKEMIIKQASSLFYVVDGLNFRILHYAGAQTYITLKSNYRGLVRNYFLLWNIKKNVNVKRCRNCFNILFLKHFMHPMSYLLLLVLVLPLLSLFIIILLLLPSLPPLLLLHTMSAMTCDNKDL